MYKLECDNPACTHRDGAPAFVSSESASDLLSTVPPGWLMLDERTAEDKDDPSTGWIELGLFCCRACVAAYASSA